MAITRSGSGRDEEEAQRLNAAAVEAAVASADVSDHDHDAAETSRLLRGERDDGIEKWNEARRSSDEEVCGDERTGTLPGNGDDDTAAAQADANPRTAADETAGGDPNGPLDSPAANDGDASGASSGEGPKPKPKETMKADGMPLEGDASSASKSKDTTEDEGEAASAGNPNGPLDPPGGNDGDASGPLSETAAEPTSRGAAWTMEGIAEPGDGDCLFGRGGMTNHHLGNQLWRAMVDEKVEKYHSSSRSHKQLVAMEIVAKWRAKVPPGRFLKQDDATDLWFDVGDERAQQKTCQALREKSPASRKRRAQDRPSAEERKEATRLAADALRLEGQGFITPVEGMALRNRIETAKAAVAALPLTVEPGIAADGPRAKEEEAARLAANASQLEGMALQIRMAAAAAMAQSPTVDPAVADNTAGGAPAPAGRASGDEAPRPGRAAAQLAAAASGPERSALRVRIAAAAADDAVEAEALEIIARGSAAGGSTPAPAAKAAAAMLLGMEQSAIQSAFAAEAANVMLKNAMLKKAFAQMQLNAWQMMAWNWAAQQLDPVRAWEMMMRQPAAGQPDPLVQLACNAEAPADAHRSKRKKTRKTTTEKGTRYWYGCSHEGCEKYAIRGGVCWRHGAKHIPRGDKRPGFRPGPRAGSPDPEKGAEGKGSTGEPDVDAAEGVEIAPLKGVGETAGAGASSEEREMQPGPREGGRGGGGGGGVDGRTGR